MVCTRRCLGLLLSAAVLAVPLSAQSGQESIPNWLAPPFWSPGEAAATPAETGDQRGGPPAIHAESALSVPTSPLPFIAVNPCRIVDTRNATEPAGYGPPSLAANVPRDFTLIGQCGIPGTAQAVSLNVTVTNTAGPGHITIWPEGEARPLASTLNYIAGQTVANAAISALGNVGGITAVAAVSGADLIIDTNGYYAGAAVGGLNTFLGISAGASITSGNGNTAIGENALQATTTGSSNTALGRLSLGSNTTGNSNTGSGIGALNVNTTGNFNTASGFAALVNNTTGSFNIAVGRLAGGNLTTGDNNICIGNMGVAGESQTIRIGDVAVNFRAFIAGVRGVTTDNGDAVPVVIDSAGQLGTVSSSARFKEDAEDMGEASSKLLKLRPVTFRYKRQAGARRQFGLIAEEVEKVLPDLVVSDSAGEVETVLYHEMPAMLLNELQKQEKRIEQQATEIEQLKAEVAALRTAVAQH